MLKHLLCAVVGRAEQIRRYGRLSVDSVSSRNIKLALVESLMAVPLRTGPLTPYPSLVSD